MLFDNHIPMETPQHIPESEMSVTDSKHGVVHSSLSMDDPRKRHNSCRRSGAFFVVASFLLGLFGGVLGWYIGPKLVADLHLPPLKMPSVSTSSPKGDAAPFASSSSDDMSIVNLVEKNSPGVVSIVITKDVPKYRSFFDNPDFEQNVPFFFFGPRGGNGSGNGNRNDGGTEKQTVGQGSGFLVSSDGMVVTNRHVVSATSADYTVITNDGKEYAARVLARDPSQDIAILKIDGANFPSIELGDSEALRVGQTVIAIGNSLGEFSNTVSRGIVSGLRRNLTAGSGFGDTERLSGIIQTDAAINPGNSGGPLIDLSGKVIGVNVAMAEGAENIGFAIPIDDVKRAIDEVGKTGKISTPFLGIRYLPITKDIQTANNLPFEYGAIVVRGEERSDFAVIPGSPADKAGIVENDIVLEIDGTKVDEDNGISDLVAKKHVGDTITLKVWHKGDTKDVKVTLEERQANF